MQPQQGKLLGIAIREKSRTPMMQLKQIQITVEDGLSGDFRGRPGPRQVTLLAVEDWRAACEDLGRELSWTTRRANLLVEGLRLCKTVGATVCIGDVRLLVTAETDPCGRMEEAAPGLCSALTPDWRGGVCCRVIAGGKIAVGDDVQLELHTEQVVD